MSKIIYSVVTIVTPVGYGEAAPSIDIPPKSLVAESVVDPAGKSDEQVAETIVKIACLANAQKIAVQFAKIMFPAPPDQFPEIDDVLPDEKPELLV